jgi:hypothetical protein
VHAAGESNHLGLDLPKDTRAVVLAVSNETELRGLESLLLAHAIPFVSIREPDKPWCGQLMAIGICPRPGKLGLLKKYKLARGQNDEE